MLETPEGEHNRPAEGQARACRSRDWGLPALKAGMTGRDEMLADGEAMVGHVS
jgi:hypothetical protein